MQDSREERTYTALRRKVLEGSLTAGTQMVTRSLAQDMGVSLAPVREAIRRLAVEGLVEHIPGAGAFVRKFSEQDLDELYVLREIVEPRAAADAARFATDFQLEELTIICDQSALLADQISAPQEEQTGESLQDQWLELEKRFHSMVVEAARNRLLKKVIVEHLAQSQIFETQRNWPGMLTAEVAHETVSEHHGLVAAIQQRDSELAAKLMLTHINNGRRMVLQAFRNSNGFSGS